MDPLSFTAGVIAVLQLANKVIALCLNLHSSLNARKELDLIVDEVDTLRNILQKIARLEGSVRLDNSVPASIETTSSHRGPLSTCRTELESLHQELGKAKSSGFKFGARAIAWVLKEKELEGRLKRLSRAKQTLQLSLSLDQTALLLQSREDSVELRTSINQANSERDRRTVVDWLGPPYPTSTCLDAQRTRSGNTGDWFLNDDRFEQWKLIPQSIVWLSGIPGSGKTILCSSIVEHMGAWCRSKDTGLLIYFFFDFTARDKNIISLFLRSLLSQVVVQRRCIPNTVQALFEQHHNGFQQPSVRILLETLRKTLEVEDQTYLIIDAMDECAERADLLDTLEEIADWRMNLNVLATSRSEVDIEEALLRMKSKHLRLGGVQVNEDIRQYVQRRMAKDRWLKKWPEDIQAEITSVVTSKAGDMFRLAALQIDGLKKCGTITALRKALYALPASLDETYSRMLDAIDPDQERDVFKILSWLCFALRPLTLGEIAEALAVNLETSEYDVTQKLQDTNDILLMCGSLVTRASGANGVLKLSHFTVKEYLTSKNILESSNRAFHITKNVADEYITKTCLVYLRSRSYRTHAETSLAFPHDPLTMYAVSFWSEHFRRSGQHTDLLALARGLFLRKERPFLDWAWIASFVPEGFYTELPRFRKPDVFLCCAAFVGSTGLLETALDNGAHINAEGCMYGTALIISVYMADLPCLKLLIRHEADVNVQAGCLGNALQAAAARGWVEGVELLLSYGADVNACGGKSGTALNAALASPYAGAQNEVVVSKLLDAGADATGTVLMRNGANYPSPLYLTCETGELKLIRLLLDKGADAQQVGCLQVALSRAHIDVANILLERGAKSDIGEPRWESPLEAATAGGLPTLRFLVEKWGADFRWRNSEGRTVLHLAARLGTLETVEHLLHLGMNIDDTDAKGWSAIHYAADAHAPEKLKLLLSKWQFDSSKLTAWSPLHIACKRNTPEAVNMLVEAGFRPTTVATTIPDWQWSLYDIAITHRNHHLISEDLQPLHPLLNQSHTQGTRPSMPPVLSRFCDACSLEVQSHPHPIFGPVFHCDQCPDFDYCFMCWLTADQTHPHTFTVLSGTKALPTEPRYPGTKILRVRPSRG